MDSFPSSATTPSHIKKHKKTIQTFAIAIGFVALISLFWIDSESQLLHKPGETNIRINEIDSSKSCTEFCNTLPKSPPYHIPSSTATNILLDSDNSKNNKNINDILDKTKLYQRVQNAKRNLIEQFNEEYGTINFHRMFVDGNTYRPFLPITPNGPSMERLKRKLMIKILSVQLKLQKQQQNQCQCTIGDNNNQVPVLERYVWASGGHSAAAGHGNLYNESYTAFLQDDLKDIFATIGIDFEARNYAMGGTSSAGEISMCWKEIFGTDVDFFSWDYGMTDGNFPQRLLHYGYRGGLSPTRPAIMGIHVGGRSRKWREQALENLERLGMAAFYGNEESWKTMRDGIPDTQGMSKSEIEQLPRYIRNFKCVDQIEKGEPFCQEEKFTKFICLKRGRQSSWHPGWKDHAMTGHGMALFLLEALLSTLKDFTELETNNYDALLQTLHQEEDALYKNLTTAELPEDHRKLYKVDEDVEPNFDPSIFFKGQSFCHTARTPSQSRYLGYLTNTDKIGGPAPYGNETYDVGIRDTEVLKSTNTDGIMRLAWTEYKERETECPVTCKPDYKDYFMTTTQDGWAKLTIPNEAEKIAYGYDPSKFQGIILFILRGCDFGKCEGGFLTREDYEEKWILQINGKPVTKIVNIGFDPIMAVGEDGIYFPPNSNGDYEIEIKVKAEKSFVKVSSFVLY